MHTTENMSAMQATSKEFSIEDWLGLSYFATTGTGDRPYNEDCYGHAADGSVVTFVVSDGIGGQAGGAAASRMVVERVRQDARSLSSDQMLAGYRAIEQEMRLSQMQRPEYSRMGATVAELRLDTARQTALWGHFGDSRVYWFRDGEVMAVTQDHSVVMSLVSAGLISEADAAHHPKKNVLLGAFGVASDIEPEVLADPVCVLDGDAFLLCTDGLWNGVTTQEMVGLLKTSNTVEQWVKALEVSARAESADDKDNYTILGVWVTSSENRTLQMPGTC